jgi:hypothetical protein
MPALVKVLDLAKQEVMSAEIVAYVFSEVKTSLKT